jgi:hypothetical protein
MTVRPHKHTHTRSLTLHTQALSHTYAQTHAHTQTHARNMSSRQKTHQTHTHNYIIPKVWLEAQQRLLRPHTLVAEGLLH